MSIHVNAADLAKHSTAKDCWIAIEGRVYDVTSYLDQHPGSKRVLLAVAGKDATVEFQKAHVTNKVEMFREKFAVGIYTEGATSCPFTLMSQLGAQMQNKRNSLEPIQKSLKASTEPRPTIERVRSAGRSKSSRQQSRMTDQSKTGSRLSYRSSRVTDHVKNLNAYLKFLQDGSRLDDFSLFFYKFLFKSSPDVHTLFEDIHISKMANKFNKLFIELVGVASLDDSALKLFSSQLALRHVQYGVDVEHIDPFGLSLLKCVTGFAKSSGFPWNEQHARSWRWLWKRVATEFRMNLSTVGPRIRTIMSSWDRLIDKASSELVILENVKWKSKKKRRNSSFTLGYDNQSMKSMRSELGLNVSEKEGFDPEKTCDTPKSKSKLENRWSGLRDQRGSLLSRNSESQLDPMADSRHSLSMQSLGVTDDPSGPEEVFAEEITWLGGQFFALMQSRMDKHDLKFDWPATKHMAKQMGRALNMIVKLATSSIQMQLEIRILAIRHIKLNITREMLATFGDALFLFLEDQLGWETTDDVELVRSEKESWKWMWESVQDLFYRHIQTATKDAIALGECKAVIQGMPGGFAALSDVFFVSLFESTPQLQQYFFKPSAQQTLMFAAALELVFEASTDPAILTTTARKLALRHIKYNFQPSAIVSFGDQLQVSLENVMRELVKDKEHCDRILGAWENMWGHLSEVFISMISADEASFVHALMVGSENDLHKALTVMPRGVRNMSCLKFSINRELVHPLMWSLQERREQKVLVLLEDLLMIRADRVQYYCGRELLYRVHPDIVELLLEYTPNALTKFLDGHMWTGTTAVEGKVRVNYYIRELYGGDPSRRRKGALTPFDTISKISNEHLHMIKHPVIQMMIDLKWSQFKMYYIVRQFFNVVSVAAFAVAGFVEDSVVALTFAFLWVTLAIYNLGVSGLQLRRARHFEKSWYETIRTGGFTTVNFLSSTVSVIHFAVRFSHQPYATWNDQSDDLLSRAFAGFNWMLMCLQLMELFKVNTRLSAFLFAMLAMIVDVGYFFAVYLLWMLASGGASYYILHTGTEYGAISVDSVGTYLYAIFLSHFSFNQENLNESDALVATVIIISKFFAAIVLLNILIASMVNSYEKISRESELLAYRARMQLIVKLERNVSRKAKTAIYRKMKLDDVVEFDKFDPGLSGGIQLQVPRSSSHETKDTIVRFAGVYDPKEPWPVHSILELQQEEIEAQERAQQMLAALDDNDEVVLERDSDHDSDSDEETNEAEREDLLEPLPASMEPMPSFEPTLFGSIEPADKVEPPTLGALGTRLKRSGSSGKRISVEPMNKTVFETIIEIAPEKETPLSPMPVMDQLMYGSIEPQDGKGLKDPNLILSLEPKV